MKSYFLIFFLFLSPRLSRAVDLLEAVTLAKKNLPLIEAQRLQIKASEQSGLQQGLWLNPVVTYDFGRGKNIFTFSDTEPYSNFILSQKFVQYGLYDLRESFAAESTKTEAIRLDTLENDVTFDVIRAYFEQLVAEEKLRHAEERTQRLKVIENFLTHRAFPSPQRRIEAYNISSRVTIRMTELVIAKKSLANAAQRLNFYLKGSPSLGPVALDAKWIRHPKSISFDEIFESARVGNVELRLLESQTKAADLEVQVLKKERWPEVTVSIQDQVYFGTVQQRTQSLGLSLPLPIFNFQGPRVRAAEYTKRSADIRRKFELDRLQNRVREAYRLFEMHTELVKQLSFEKMEQLESHVKYADGEFQKGRVELLTFLDFDDQHETLFTTVLNAQMEYVMALLDLSRLTGSANLAVENLK
jgi:outer membrane protein TolC